MLFRSLLETYSPNQPGIRLLQYDEFARYCVKMATGSGKTNVMSLAVAHIWVGVLPHSSYVGEGRPGTW